MTLRVLLVDDDDRFRAMARRALLADGVDVTAEAVDGADALRAVGQARPDLVLLDIGLPDMSGVEVARRLVREDGAPLIVLISTRDVEYGRRMAVGVAAGYIRKDLLSGAAIRDLTGSS